MASSDVRSLAAARPTRIRRETQSVLNLGAQWITVSFWAKYALTDIFLKEYI